MDLTIIYSTAHKIPDGFRQKVLKQLRKSAKNYPIVELHSTPEKSSILNYYRELLYAAKRTDTPYLAFAEDDALYPDEHFDYRSEVFAYNFTRWNLATWSDPPFFSLAHRKILTTLICPRELFIQNFEERFKVDPNGERLRWWGEPGRSVHEKQLGITQQPSEEFYTYTPIVVFSHPAAFAYETTGKKRSGRIRATALPCWGSAEEVVKLWS